MRMLGLQAGAVVRLVREARDGGSPHGSILVVGPLAPQLARLLVADGGDRTLVRTGGGDAFGASVVVCVLAGEPTAEQVAVLRSAARASVPAVAVQMGDDVVSVPYVLAGDVIACSPGQGFPIEAITNAVCRALGRRSAPLAARLPALREDAGRAIGGRAAGVAAGVAAAPWGSKARLPLLVSLQARMLRDLAVASGAPAPVTQHELGIAVGPEIGAALGVGALARTFVHRLPRSRLVDGAVAGGVTLALATAARSPVALSRR